MSDPMEAPALAFAAAEKQQQAAQAVLTELRVQIQALPDTARDTLRRALIEALSGLHTEVQEATEAIQHLHRRARRQLLWLAPATVGLGLGAGLAAATLVIPTKAEIAERRATVEALKRTAGEAVLLRCEDRTHRVRVCVRVDTAAGAFGPHHDYYLLP